MKVIVENNDIPTDRPTNQPTNQPTDGHQGRTNQPTTDIRVQREVTLPIKYPGSLFTKSCKKYPLNSSIVMDPSSGYNFNFDSSQLLIKQHFLDAMYFYLSLLKVR